MAGIDNPAKRGQPSARPPMDPISIRISEVVRITGLSRSKVYMLIADGDIEAAKVGRATLVYVKSLREFLAASPRHRHGGDRRSRNFVRSS